MGDQTIDRRHFIGTCLATAAGLCGLGCERRVPDQQWTYDAKGLPTRVLGKTGVSVPLIVIGGGSRFCSVSDPEESAAILELALDSGLYHWDTAHDYVYDDVVSEERYGIVLNNRRDEVFLATKVQERTYDGAMRHVEESLQRLQTDHLDLLQIHDVQSLDDVAVIGAEGGVLQALQELKEQGVTRFIGYTGHSSAEALAAMAGRHDFDTMLCALNHYDQGQEDREGRAIPRAASRNMGILVMKVIRPREAIESVTADELLRYALSLEHVTAAVIGTDSIEVVRQNTELIRNFERLSAPEMERISGTLEPLFNSGRLAWMRPGYRDGSLT
ncbi:MAG: aldo/keto reductase [Gemmatimonadales bacterium]|nr:aldo/keto reductase [Gemmatimonadales bacterium]NIN10475.1 aldo/keto reductase [Gemmatimonadales bacterium]NIQ98935.1 aldo/keto reductase [Gemmatimonadales bacterium]NIS63763.1 aldo/keto reductase [Gemmatimonadales bacterium]